MEQPLAGEPGGQQVFVTGDEVLNGLLLQSPSLEKQQQTLSCHTAHRLTHTRMKTVADPG